MTVATVPPKAPAVVAQAPDSAVSPEGLRLRCLVEEAVAAGESVSLRAHRRKILQAIDDAVHADALVDAVSSASAGAISYAISLADMLPSDIPGPEVSVDDDGDILFDWDRGRRQIFTISVSPDGTLKYAGLFGGNRAYGTERLAEALPEAIRLNLSRALDREPTQDRG